MRLDQITILSAKFGKKVVMGYYSLLDNKNHSIENEEIPHPDLKKALTAFNKELASAFYIDDKDSDHFITNGFIIHEKNGDFSLEIKGKVSTNYDDVKSVSSGKILYEDGGEVINELISDKLMELRIELFDYMFNNKNAQGKLDFKE